jgi:hypothetical protein
MFFGDASKNLSAQHIVHSAYVHIGTALFGMGTEALYCRESGFFIIQAWSRLSLEHSFVLPL